MKLPTFCCMYNVYDNQKRVGYVYLFYLVKIKEQNSLDYIFFSIRQGLKVIARHGTFVEFSVFGGEISADWSIIGKYPGVTVQ